MPSIYLISKPIDIHLNQYNRFRTRSFELKSVQKCSSIHYQGYSQCNLIGQFIRKLDLKLNPSDVESCPDQNKMSLQSHIVT